MSRQFVSLMANRNLKYPYEWEPWLDQAYLEGMGLRNLEWDIPEDRSEINVSLFHICTKGHIQFSASCYLSQ